MPDYLALTAQAPIDVVERTIASEELRNYDVATAAIAGATGVFPAY